MDMGDEVISPSAFAKSKLGTKVALLGCSVNDDPKKAQETGTFEKKRNEEGGGRKNIISVLSCEYVCIQYCCCGLLRIGQKLRAHTNFFMISLHPSR